MFECVISIISGGLPFCLTVFLGGYLTLKTKFFQIRNFRRSLSVFKGNKEQGISGFSAMCNSLSAAVGTGNIVGVAAAISIGGAGAVFWMWVSAFLGMTVKAAEIALGVFYRQKSGNNFVGGPHIYIQKALPKTGVALGFIFAFCGILATVFCGNMTQVNSAVSTISNRPYVKVTFGVLIAILVLFTVRGGAKRITSILSKILPIMAVLYIALCGGVIIRNYELLPIALKQIFIGAFKPEAVTGGAVGSMLISLSIGASKGIFSNEAGVGTAAIAHSLVSDATPLKQSFFGIFEVFVDTILLCSLTALTILSSGVIIEYGNTPSFDLTLRAFCTLYGSGARFLLSTMLMVFGVSSVIGWATYGISFSECLFKEKGKKLFMVIYPVFCILGAVLSAGIIWQIAELLNGILVIINLLVLTYLRKTVLVLLKEKENDKKKN